MLSLEISAYSRDLDWDKLKTFYYVAKVGNISNAAPFLNITQSCSSRHITGLEKHLGYPLFIRTRNGVTLNRKGEKLLGIVENIFVDVHEFTSRKHEPLEPGQRRKIRIASQHALVAYLINNLILEYNKDRPEILFEVIGLNQNIDVILHDVDIAIQPHDPKMDSINWQIIQEPFFTLEMKLYASKQYLERYGEPKNIDDLKHHHLILPSHSNNYSIDRADEILKLDKNSNKKHDPIFMSNSLECLVEAAQQGKGIIRAYDGMSIIQKANLQNILPDLIIKKRQEYFVYPEYLKDDPDIIHLKDYLRSRVKAS